MFIRMPVPTGPQMLNSGSHRLQPRLHAREILGRGAHHEQVFAPIGVNLGFRVLPHKLFGGRSGAAGKEGDGAVESGASLSNRMLTGFRLPALSTPAVDGGEMDRS